MKTLWKRIIFDTLFLVAALLSANPARAQGIKVNPTGVNVNTQNATVVFLTFGPLVQRLPAEGCWCGALIPAASELGLQCDPSTIFGCLPARFDLSRLGANQAFTDIMTIPPSVARRAYQAAEGGAESRFFYVRRFVSTTGLADEYVNVTCRLTGGGARTPFSLTDVKLAFGVENLVLAVNPSQQLPPIKAEITYNGTGRLKGRWEVVMPGDEPPSEKDLLTEASLPLEERATQRRYTRLSTFNVFLPPDSKYTLAGPKPSLLPNKIQGEYLLLLRVEATDDKEGDSNLAAVGVGAGVVHSGAVAGFPLPVLRYYVGSSNATPGVRKLSLVLPPGTSQAISGKPIELGWSEIPNGTLYRLEIENGNGQQVLAAMLLHGASSYRIPPWIKSNEAGLRWRVVALDSKGNPKNATSWRLFR